MTGKSFSLLPMFSSSNEVMVAESISIHIDHLVFCDRFDLTGCKFDRVALPRQSSISNVRQL